MAINKSKRKKKVSRANHSETIESDSEVKSFIYQQLAEFNPYVSAETVIMVIARDPKEPLEIEDEHFEDVDLSDKAHRIAIVLEEDGATLEAEAFHDDIFEAIKLAKVSLIDRLAELQEEVEKPNERLDFINSISNNGQLH
jgi:ribosome-associated translation inhibitor RaiA